MRSTGCPQESPPRAAASGPQVGAGHRGRARRRGWRAVRFSNRLPPPRHRLTRGGRRSPRQISGRESAVGVVRVSRSSGPVGTLLQHRINFAADRARRRITPGPASCREPRAARGESSRSLTAAVRLRAVGRASRRRQGHPSLSASTRVQVELAQFAGRIDSAGWDLSCRAARPKGAPRQAVR